MAYNGQAPFGQQYPNQRPVNDPWVQALMQAGTDFWAARNVSAAGARPYVADDLDGPVAVGFDPSVYGQAGVAFAGDQLGMLLANARNRKYSVRGRRRNLQRVGAYVFHELGHVGGLPHQEEQGLMDRYGSEIPWEVKVLSRKLIPREPRKKIRRR